MNYVQGAREEAAAYYYNPMPMKGYQFNERLDGYTSPEQIEAARMNAAYYNQHPGGMRDWAESGLDGLAEVFDSKGLMYAAIGAVAAGFLLPKKWRPKGKMMTYGVGAVAGLAVAKMM